MQFRWFDLFKYTILSQPGWLKLFPEFTHIPVKQPQLQVQPVEPLVWSMEQINLGYSLKDIPLPDDKTQIQILIQSWEVTDKAMRWKILKTFNPEAFGNEKKEKF